MSGSGEPAITKKSTFGITAASTDSKPAGGLFGGGAPAKPAGGMFG